MKSSGRSSHLRQPEYEVADGQERAKDPAPLPRCRLATSTQKPGTRPISSQACASAMTGVERRRELRLRLAEDHAVDLCSPHISL